MQFSRLIPAETNQLYLFILKRSLCWIKYLCIVTIFDSSTSQWMYLILYNVWYAYFQHYYVTFWLFPLHNFIYAIQAVLDLIRFIINGAPLLSGSKLIHSYSIHCLSLLKWWIMGLPCNNLERNPWIISTSQCSRYSAPCLFLNKSKFIIPMKLYHIFLLGTPRTFRCLIYYIGIWTFRRDS